MRRRAHSIQTLTHALLETGLSHRAGPALDVALVPEREGEQPPELAAQVLPARHVVVEQAPHRLRPEVALAPNVSGESISRAKGSSSPRSQAAAGIENPRFRRLQSERQSGAAAFRSSTFFRRPRTLCRSGAPARGSSRPSRGTAPAPRASAPSTRGRSSPAGRRRDTCRGRRPGAARAARRPRSPRTAREGVDRVEAPAPPGQLGPRLGEKISFQP